MFAEVILHRRVPSRFESFTYAVPDNLNLKPGQLVQVPFRAQCLAAVVRNLHSKNPPYPTKLLESASATILRPWQMELATWMSKKYETSFSKVIDFFVPEKVWPRKTKKRATENATASAQTSAQSMTARAQGITASAQGPAHGPAALPTPHALEELINKLLKTPTSKFVFEKTLLPRKEFYASLQSRAQNSSPILILFPEIFHLKQLAGNLPLFHSELSEQQKAEAWLAVYDEKLPIIAGTRAALFLPFKKLGAIVLDFEHSESYNEKRAPYYHALTVAEKVAEMHGCPLIIISGAPRTETWHKAQIAQYEKHEWDQGKNAAGASIIDMANERRKGVTGLFAEEVIEKTARALGGGAQVLFFINRKGRANALLCTDCGTVIRCSKCISPFAIHGQDKLVCHRCKISSVVPAVCGFCGSPRLRFLGAGTEKVEQEIAKVFAKANILRIDKDGEKQRKKSGDTLLQDLNKADIIIATQIIDKPLNLERLKLSVVVMPDNLLNVPDFRAHERLVQLLTSIRQLTGGITGDGEVLIQTFIPDHSLFKSLSANRLEDFYGCELETREGLGLPPFPS